MTLILQRVTTFCVLWCTRKRAFWTWPGYQLLRAINAGQRLSDAFCVHTFKHNAHVTRGLYLLAQMSALFSYVA